MFQESGLPAGRSTGAVVSQPLAGISHDDRMTRRVASVLLLAGALVTGLLVAVTTVAVVEPSVVEAAPAPTGPLPECVEGGLGCVDGPLTAGVEGTYSAGASFTITTNGAGLAPCPYYTSTGCYYDLFEPSFVRCVYLVDGDPTKVQSCPPISSSGSVVADSQGRCFGTFGSTYIYGGDARFPDRYWTARARDLARCEFSVGEGDVDNLYGPTFMLYRTRVNECLAATLAGCVGTGTVREGRSGYVWVPVTGELADDGVVAGCRAEQSTGNPNEAIFTSESGGPPGSEPPDLEWSLSDGTEGSTQVITTEVDEPGTVDATITARLGGDSDTDSCSVDMVAPELSATLEAKLDGVERDETRDFYVPLGEEFDLTLTVEASTGIGDLTIAIDDLTEIFDQASDVDVVTSPAELGLPVELESDETKEFTWRLRGAAVSDFAFDLTLVATDTAGEEQDSIEVTDEGSVVSALVVNSTNGSQDDFDPGDGTCDTGDLVTIDGEEVPECTLAAAITEANEGTVNADGERVITFDVPGGRTATIEVRVDLPELEGPATIDGTTQGDLGIHIQGRQGAFDGLRFVGSGVVAVGLTVTDFTGTGVVLDGEGNHEIRDSYLGQLPLDPNHDAGNGRAGITVASPGNTIGSSDDGNTLAYNGDDPADSVPQPGMTADDSKAGLPAMGNVVVVDDGSATIAGNTMSFGVGLVVTEDADGVVELHDNEIRSSAAVIIASEGGGPFLASNNTITGSTTGPAPGQSLGIAVARGKPASLSSNEIDRLSLGLLGIEADRLSLFDNTIDTEMGVLLIGGRRASIGGNEIGGDIGILSVDDDAETEHVIKSNEFIGKTGVLGVGHHGDTVENNEFSGGTGAMFIRSSELAISNNRFDETEVGVWLISQLGPAFGGNTVSDNDFPDTTYPVIAMEERATIENNTMSGDIAVGVLASPTAGSVIRDNAITGGAIGLLVLDSAASEIHGNVVEGAAFGAIAASDASAARAAGADTDEQSLYDKFFANIPDIATDWLDVTDLGFSLDPSALFRTTNSVGANTWTANRFVNNDAGLVVYGDADGTEIGRIAPGDGNIISGNRQIGLLLGDAGQGTPEDITIRGNSVFDNGVNATPATSVLTGLGGSVPDIVFRSERLDNPSSIGLALNDALDLDDGPNGLQNHPIVTDLADDGTISGQLFSETNSSYLIDFYANDGACNPTGYGGGQHYLGSVDATTNASGQAPFTFASTASAVQTVTAIATAQGLVGGSSSQFSYCIGTSDTATVTVVSAASGERRLQVSNTEQFEVGDFVVINPGGPNEEGGIVDGFGSIILEQPLQFDHDAGELIMVTDKAPPSPPAPPEPTAPPAIGGVTPVSPARLADTRNAGETIDGRVEGVGAVQGGTSLRIPVHGRGDVPPSATSVVVNTVAVDPADRGFLALYPCDEEVPSTSSVNYGTRPVDVNNALVKLSTDGALCVFSKSNTHVVLDVTAYAEGDEALAPRRLADSRQGFATDDGKQEAFGRVAAKSTTEIQVAGRGGVPADAAAVAVNVTAVRPGKQGFATLFPCDEDQPLASNLNFTTGVVRPNAAIVALSSAGSLCVYTSAATDLVVDVTASFADVPSFTPLNPARLLETRPGEDTVDGRSEGLGRLVARSTTRVQVAGRGGVPADATLAAVNLAAVLPSAQGFITLFPCDEDRPTASSMNFVADEVIANSGVVKLDAGGSVCVYTHRQTHLVMDVNAAWATSRLAPT